jgi:hypothetical protein
MCKTSTDGIFYASYRGVPFKQEFIILYCLYSMVNYIWIISNKYTLVNMCNRVDQRSWQNPNEINLTIIRLKYDLTIYEVMVTAQIVTAQPHANLLWSCDNLIQVVLTIFCSNHNLINNQVKFEPLIKLIWIWIRLENTFNPP